MRLLKKMHVNTIAHFEIFLKNLCGEFTNIDEKLKIKVIKTGK